MRLVLFCALLALAPLARAEAAPTYVLRLEEALIQARAKSPMLRTAQAERDAIDARGDRARAALLPQLSGTASYMRTTGNFIPRPGQLPQGLNQSAEKENPWEMFNSYNLGASASQVLYDFGAIARLRSAKATTRAAEERVRASELELELSVREAYFQARARRALMGVARETLENHERHLTQAQAFVEVGTRPEIELSQVRAELASAKVTLLQAENDYALAKLELQRIMGVRVDGEFEIEETRLEPLRGEEGSGEELLREALSARPDVRALDNEVRATSYLETGSQGAFGPALSAVATGTRAGIELDDLRWNVAAGVQLSWPLVRGGATLAERREARANSAAADARMEELRQLVRLQVERARRGVLSAVAVLGAAGEALEHARSRLQLAEGRYEAGVGNIIELGDAQLALTQAEAQSVSAEYDLSTARAQLLSALGRSR